MPIIFFLTLLTMCNLFGQENISQSMNREYIFEIISKLERGENIIFTKYGDGEYYCMINLPGHNLDLDNYNPWLGVELKKALINLSMKPNAYIGKWRWNNTVYSFCDEMAKQNGVVIPWYSYTMFLNDDVSLNFNYMYHFVKFITQTKRKKIVVCNHMNKRIKDFLKADVYIEIPMHNWSYEYNKWRDMIESYLEKDAIVLTSAGMCSKVLINDILITTILPVSIWDRPLISLHGNNTVAIGNIPIKKSYNIIKILYHKIGIKY